MFSGFHCARNSVLPDGVPPSPIICTEKLSFWGERRDYFHYLSDQIADMKALESCCKKVNSYPKVGHVDQCCGERTTQAIVLLLGNVIIYEYY